MADATELLASWAFTALGQLLLGLSTVGVQTWGLFLIVMLIAQLLLERSKLRD
jgi:hypothetical protein